MNLSIFYEHGCEAGGAPAGVRNLAAGLERSGHDVQLIAQQCSGTRFEAPGVRVRTYRNRRDLRDRFAGWLAQDQPDAVLLIGFFIPANLVALDCATRAGVPVVLHPLAQVWPKALETKIFTNGWDVRSLERRKVNRPPLGQYAKILLSPVLKRAYMRTIGAPLGTRSSRIAVLSSEERRAFQHFFPRPNSDFLSLPWGIDPGWDRAGGQDDFFHATVGVTPGLANFVVWSRLDWHYKGLDRLLEGVRRDHAASNGDLPYRLFLCGPDYRGGTVRARAYVARHGLAGTVKVLGPGDYQPGSLAPLRDADASILLSPWDGSPRALRESIALGTPIVVSRETNFGDLVDRFGCGTVVGDPDAPEQVARALRIASDGATLQRWRAGIARAAEVLEWTAIAGRFADDLSRGPARGAQGSQELLASS